MPWRTLFIFAAALFPACAPAGMVIVDVATQKAVMPLEGLGLNAAVFDRNMVDDPIAGVVEAAGFKILRLGGSYADFYHWQSHTATFHTNYLAPQATFTNFMTRLVVRAHATAMITVNYGSNPDGTGGADPEEAADWVRFANVTNGWNIKYWEIGNEIYGNGFYQNVRWEMDLHPDKSPAEYGRNVNAFVRAMKAVDPSIKIGAVLATPGYWPDKLKPNWNRTVLQQCGRNIDFVIIHWYPDAGSPDQGGAKILPKTAEIPAVAAALRALINTYCGTNAPNVKIAVTETGAGNIEPQLAPGEALFTTETLLSWIEHGAFNLDWQELFYFVMSFEGKPGRPYYGVMMAHLLAGAGDRLLGVSCLQPGLSAHAAAQKNGIGVLLINPDTARDAEVQVRIDGAPLADIATVYRFGRTNFAPGAPNPSSGPSTNRLSGFSRPFTITIPAMSMATVCIPVATNLSGARRFAPRVRTSGALDLLGKLTLGAPAQVMEWKSGPAQSWQVRQLSDGFYTLSPQSDTHSLLELAPAPGTIRTGAAPSSASRTDRQQWAIIYNGDGSFRISPRAEPSLALSVRDDSAVDGAAVESAPWVDGEGQRWYLFSTDL